LSTEKYSDLVKGRGSQTKQDCRKYDGIKQYQTQRQGNVFVCGNKFLFVKNDSQFGICVAVRKGHDASNVGKWCGRDTCFSPRPITRPTNHRNHQCPKDVPTCPPIPFRDFAQNKKSSAKRIFVSLLEAPRCKPCDFKNCFQFRVACSNPELNSIGLL
jgi:hypothetical protein